MKVLANRRQVLAGAAAMGVAAWTWPATAQQVGKDTLRVVVHADLKILDPVFSNAWITVRHCYLIADTLYSVDSNLMPQPQMVEAHEIDGAGLNYRFTLREGLKFHDGQPVRAADAVASMKRWLKNSGDAKRLGSYVDALNVVDDRTFALNLREPYAMVLDTLARPQGPLFVFPERIVSKVKDGDQFSEVMGSGPFVFVKDEWQPGSKVVYKKNPDYVPRKEPADFLSGGKIAYLQRVEWLTMPDPNTTLSALMSGEVDYFEVPPLDFIALAENNPDLKVQVFDAVGLHGFIRPNFLQPPFSDVRARQALALLVDQENFMRAAVGNPKLYRKCFAYFMCGSPNETQIGSETYQNPNVEKAKALLKEAGYNGEEIVIITPSQAELPVFFSLATYLGQALNEAGIKARTEVLDWASFVARRANKGPVAQGGWNLFCSFQGGPDTSVPAQNYWFNSTCGASAQGWPCDEQLEKLTLAYSMERDPKKRRELVDQIQKRGFEYFPLILLGQFTQPIITRANVEGVLAASQAVYWNIRKT